MGNNNLINFPGFYSAGFWDTFKIFWPIIWQTLWPILLILIVVAIFRLFFDELLPNFLHKIKMKRRFEKGSKWRSDKDLLYWLRSMYPNEFEHYIAHLFEELGFKTNRVGGSYDGGIDVIAEKDGIKHYIQCKKFITQQVSVGALRDFYGALADHLTNGKGYFITTNKFTLEAEKFAEDKPIELIDGYRLLDYIKLADKNEHKDK